MCHYPSGSSKWNPIEHRLFSYISLNWAGEPLTSYNKALGYINSTQTATGLAVNSYLVKKDYQTGIKITKEQMNSLNLNRHETCPQWNYDIISREIS